jgi:hypothetical protein
MKRIKMLKKRFQISDFKFQNVKFNKFAFMIFVLFYNFSSYSQCAMCRASLEGEGNVKKAEAVNDGIVYLMVIPYILAGFVAIIIYRMYSKRKKV